LADADAVFAPLIAAHRPLTLGSRGDAFQTLARAMVGQQISVKAAQSVWERLVALVGTMNPGAVAGFEPSQLRTAGLSERKAEYLLDLSRHFLDDRLEPHAWPALPDEALIEQLVHVRGIGRWTAEMFLIFNLARPDVLPVGDLGLRRAMSIAYKRGRPISERQMRLIARKWSPWRSVATWYMWRSLEATPVEY
jgi:DNA-3-methyladenine glycosylase II